MCCCISDLWMNFFWITSNETSNIYHPDDIMLCMVIADWFNRPLKIHMAGIYRIILNSLFRLQSLSSSVLLIPHPRVVCNGSVRIRIWSPRLCLIFYISNPCVYWYSNAINDHDTFIEEIPCTDLVRCVLSMIIDYELDAFYY